AGALSEDRSGRADGAQVAGARIRRPAASRLIRARNTATRMSGSKPSGRCELEQDSASDFVGILFAAVAEDHDAELAARHHPDIGGCVVETAVFFDDGRRVCAEDLPGWRLPVARADGPDVLLRQAHRLAQRPLDRQLAEISGEKDGHVARRGIHLARSRPAVVALLTARLAEWLAFVGVAL